MKICVSRHFSSKQARINSLMSGLFERKMPLFFHEVLCGLRWLGHFDHLLAGLISTHDKREFRDRLKIAGGHRFEWFDVFKFRPLFDPSVSRSDAHEGLSGAA
jgi:hypothetical protein